MHKERFFKSVRKLALILFYAMLSCTVFFTLLVYRDKILNKTVSDIGVQAVNCLYDFGTVEQLDFQMQGLKEITTDAVFNQLTIDNEERTLNTYLKFKNKPVTVEIVDATNDYVLYRLKTEEISIDRLFCFYFRVNKAGKIDTVREVEAIDFINSYR